MATTHTGTGRGVNTLTHSLTWPFLLLALATLFIYMSGLASVQDWCSGNGMPGVGMITNSVTNPGTSAASGVFGMSASYTDCKRLYRFYWFSWAFVLATLLGILITLFLNWGLHHSRPFWIGMLTISTILMMVASEAFLAFTDLIEGNNQSGQWMHRMRTTTAGAIMTIPFLIGLMLSIGTDWERRTDGLGHNKPGTGLAGSTDPAVTNV